MKMVIIHGQSQNGSNCYIARMLADKIGGETTDFLLPKEFGEFCCGCTRCFKESKTKCPHYYKLSDITQTIDEADVIILASPVYVYHATGAMKAFLDHYGWRWMVHRPEERMFKKQGVCISTAAGGGMRSTNKDMADSLFYWGVAKIFKFGIGVAAINWDKVSEKKKRSVEKATDSIAEKIQKRNGRVKAGIKTKGFFFLRHMLQKKGWNEADVRYWKEQGWTEKARPWKQSKGESTLL